MKKICSLCLILMNLMLSVGAAQRGVTISGTTEDSTGAAISEESLTLTNKETGAVRKTVSDASGAFTFKDVAPGQYTLKGEAEGFKSAKLTVTVGAESLNNVKLTMEISMSDEVTISAKQSEPIAPENNAASVSLNSAVLSSLPSLDENPLSVVSNFLSPIAQGADGPSIVVDGVETGDLSVPAVALKQVSVNKNPYSSEYRRPGAGRVEATTRNGSRGHFDGSFAVFARNSVFDARNAFAVTKPDLSRQLFEGSLSGPMFFKKTRFFVSGTRLASDESAIVNALTLGGPLVANVPTSRFATNLLGRIDVRDDGPTSISLAYTFYDQPERNFGVGGLRLAEQGISRDRRGHRVQFAYTTLFSANLLNVARLNFERRTDSLGNPAGQPAIIVQGAFTGGPSQTARFNRETRFELQDVATLSHGAHTFKFGGGVKPRFYTFMDASNFGGTFTFSTLDDFAAGRPTLFQIARGNPQASFAQPEAYGFFEDAMKLRPDLNLTLGLRYDWQAKVSDRNNFAPRAAIAYAPGQGKTVLRAGAGLFYDHLDDRAIQRTLLVNGSTISEIVIANPSFIDPLNSAIGIATPPSIWQFAPSIQSPYLIQGTLTVERKLTNNAQLSVEYQTFRGVHLFRSRNVNAPVDGVLPDPDFLLIRQIESSGSLRGNALVASFQGRIIKPLKIKAQYTLSRTTDDVDDLFALPADSNNLQLERGRADFDRRHRFNFAGILDLPWKFRAASLLTLSSGTPFDVTTGFDDNGDRVVNDRPLGVGRNTGRGPGFAQLDMRFSKLFSLPIFFGGRDKDRGELRDFELNFDVFNVLNRNNLTDVIGDLSSPLFGQANASLQARTIQLSLKFNFRAYTK